MDPTEMARMAQARRERYERLRQITPQQAQNLTDLARENPSLTPGALYGAGVSGVRAGTPASKAVGEADRQVKSEKGNWFQRGISASYKKVKSVGGAVAPDVVGEVLGGVGSGLKGVARGATIGLDSIGQTFQGAFRESVADGDIKGAEWLGGLPHLAEGFRQSDLYAADKEVEQNGGYAGLARGIPGVPGEATTKVDFGSGFFAGGNVARRSGQARTDAGGGARIGGKLPTMGRYLANELDLEPGGIGYNLVSGLADASMMLASDPTLGYGKVLTRTVPVLDAAKRASLSGAASRRFDAEGVAARVEDSLVRTATERATAMGDDLEGVTREQLLTRMGAINGIRKSVDSDRTLEFLTVSKQGRQLVDYLSKETDFGKLYDATKGRIEPKLLREISSRQMTGDEVVALLGTGGADPAVKGLGRTARTENKFGLDAVGKAALGTMNPGTLASASFRRRARDVRMFGAVPERVLRKDDINQTLQTASDVLRNAGIGADEVVTLRDGRTLNRSSVLESFVEADGGPRMFEASKDLMEVMASKAISEFGVSNSKATELFKMWDQATTDNRKYFIEQIEENGTKAWANKAFNVTFEKDEDFVRALPFLASQFLDSNVPLPDPRDIRNVMSRYAGILGHGKERTDAAGKFSRIYGGTIQVPQMAMLKIQDEIFKPAALLRPAFVARNQIDEQFRLVGAGLNGAFNHPVQYLNWLIADQDGFGKTLAKAGFKSRGQTFDADGGQYFDELRAGIRTAKENLQNVTRTGTKGDIDEAKAGLARARDAYSTATPLTDGASAYTRAVTGGAGNWSARGAATARDGVVMSRRDVDFSKAMAEGLHEIFTNPLVRRIAAGDDLDQIKADWWRGPLQAERLALGKIDDRMSKVNDELGAAQYVDYAVQYLNSFVGGSSVLRDAAATGKINGVSLVDGDNFAASARALEELDALKNLDEYQGPSGIPGMRTVTGKNDEPSKREKAVNWMFYQLADRPTRYLARSPAFRQRYYQRMESLIGFMDEGAAKQVIDAAKEANLKGGAVRRLEKKQTAGTGLTWEEADLVAKTDALEFTEDLFYSLHRKNQALDAMKLIFPFGEAFRDSAVKYSQIVASNPRMPYRLLQTIEAGRDADINGDGKAFFYTDEQTGQEMVAFPGSEQVLGMLGQEGAGIMRGPLANLNILGTSVIPGFGPVVQIAAAEILPDEVDFNGVRKFVSPYGDETLEGGALESFLPAWFNKFRTGGLPLLRASPEQQVQFVQVTKDWMGYLASTGEYNLQDPADSQRLRDDAKGKARSTFYLRGLAQAFAPTPPSPEFVAYDKDGKLQTQFRLAELYRDIQTEQRELGTPEAADRIYIETVGEQAVLAIVPNTKAAEGKSPLPPNREALEFLQNNKAAADRFPSVFSLFAPDEETADFDFTAYRRSIEKGELVPVSAEEAVQRANQKVARMIVRQFESVIDEGSPKKPDGSPKRSAADKDKLKELKAKLAEDFPGYSGSFNNSLPAVMEDLKRAAADPSLSKTSAGEGLGIWLQARDIAERQAQEEFGVSWKQSPKARDIRDRMRALGDKLSEDFAGFTNLYERALEDEMARDN